MTAYEYFDHESNNDGYCDNCDEWTSSGGVEPDAVAYVCPECGEPELYGAQAAMEMSLFDIDEE